MGGSGNSYPWKLGCGPWCKKYFWKGQQNVEPQQQEDELYGMEGKMANKLLTEYRRALGLVIPAMVVHFFWWSVMIKHDLWYLFPDRYVLVITMVFASFLAGLTSIGGGTVAFPVLTLILQVSPSIARDFGLLIQSFGMTSATFTIMFLGVQIEWHAIIFGTLGGAFGLIVGLEFIEKHMTPSLKKMLFASFWFSFAFALFLLNRYRKRKTYPKIMIFTWWKGLVLIITGIVGGIFTSFVGSGLDICSLSVLTLFFRLSEKQATPTSVILMAVNSVLGLFWRQAIQNTVALDTWKYVVVCAVVVVIGAPFGSFVGTHFHRLVLACIIYVTVGLTLISSYILVPQTATLVGISVSVIIVGGIIFISLTVLGQKLLEKELREAKMRRGKVEEEEGDTEDKLANKPSDEANGHIKIINGNINDCFLGDESHSEKSVVSRL